MKIHDFQRMKHEHEKITMLTCYDYWSAILIENTDIDGVLVGDSLSMIMHGSATTIPATINMMSSHVQAVSKGLKTKFLIADLPFLTVRKGISYAMECVQQIMQSGAHAVKLEGATGNLELIEHMVESGIPVMGHLGLMPQSYHQLGGHIVQGKSVQSQEKLLQDAKDLANVGCFAIVLECIPQMLAKSITQKLEIPTIGIGAGKDVDGQILVFHDLLGLMKGLKLKFVKRYLNGAKLMSEAIQKYHADVKNQIFPGVEHSF